MSPRTARLLLALVVVAPLLTACTTTVALSPSPRANEVGCADVVVRLPHTLEKLSMRETNAQGTAAWGKPAAVVLSCGITTPAVSDLSCFSVGGVDWLVDEKKATEIYTTYGRSPGVQIVTDDTVSTNVLFDLASSVSKLPQTGKCQSPEDATPSATPTPTP